MKSSTKPPLLEAAVPSHQVKKYSELPTLASFEQRSLLGLPFKDINLALIVIVCILSGAMFIRMQSPRRKGITSVVVSLLCIWFASEGQTHRAAAVIFFVFLQTILLYLIRSIGRLRSIALIGLFTMTSVFRFLHEEWLNAQLSLVLMMQLLKLVGAAFDMVECRSLDEVPISPDKLAQSEAARRKTSVERSQNTGSSSSASARIKCAPSCPTSFWLLLGYTYCHCGLVLGPFFRYRVYYDWLQTNSDHYKRNQIAYQTIRLARQKLYLVSVLFVMMLLNQQLSPMNSLVIDADLSTIPRNYIDQVSHNPQVALILNALLAFYLYRARLYFGFLLGEFVCMACGLGAYPVECESLPGHGPKYETTGDSGDRPVQVDYQAINTVDGLSAEITGSIRRSMRHWNLPTQYWLARHVYSPMRHFPVLIRLYSTLTISALWHGVYSGYFLSFFVLPLLFWVENPWNKYVDDVHQSTLSVFSGFWLLKILLLSYFGVPFYLLRWSVSIKYWQAVNW